MKIFRSIRIVTLAVLALSGAGALAHHGTKGMYDTSKPIVLIGKVTRATFSPPHPVVSVRAEAGEPPRGVGRADEFVGPLAIRQEDIGQVREIEFPPARMFYDLGERVRVGDRVVIIALRNCLAPHQLRSTWIQLPDGKILSHTTGLHRKTEGCR